MKPEAVLLYMSGMSMNATAKLLGVSTQSVLNWIRDFGEANYEKPTSDSVIVVELDELWHFLQRNSRARFHRRTKVVSRSVHMVDIAMAIFAKCRVNANIKSLRNWRLSLLS